MEEMVNSIKEEIGVESKDNQAGKPVVAAAPKIVKTEKSHHSHSKKASTNSKKVEVPKKMEG